MSLPLPDFHFDSVATCDTDFSQFKHQHTTFDELISQTHQGLIIYFYPKDNTAGCSTQAEDFSRLQPEFVKLGYTIVGVSRDSLKSHEKFISNKHITFALISDTEQQLCDYFGVMGEKNMYGKKIIGVVRSTFVFDHQGNLQHELRNVRAKGHADSLLELLQK